MQSVPLAQGAFARIARATKFCFEFAGDLVPRSSREDGDQKQPMPSTGCRERVQITPTHAHREFVTQYIVHHAMHFFDPKKKKKWRQIPIQHMQRSTT